MAKTENGADESLQLFDPKRLKIELHVKTEWPDQGCKLTATLYYNKQKIDEDSVELNTLDGVSLSGSY